MGRSRQERTGTTHRLSSHMPVASRKNVIAAVLMMIMGIMWARLLMGRAPKSTVAKPVTTQNEQVEQTPALNVRFVQLPVMAGRNDRVYRDFFTVGSWRAFSKVSASRPISLDPEVPVVPSNWNQEVFARVAQKFRLEGVFPPNAMINDQLVTVGHSITIKDGADTYVFEVRQINEDSVVVARDGHTLTLKLEVTQSNDVSK